MFFKHSPNDITHARAIVSIKNNKLWLDGVRKYIVKDSQVSLKTRWLCQDTLFFSSKICFQDYSIQPCSTWSTTQRFWFHLWPHNMSWPSCLKTSSYHAASVASGLNWSPHKLKRLFSEPPELVSVTSVRGAKEQTYIIVEQTKVNLPP